MACGCKKLSRTFGGALLFLSIYHHCCFYSNAFILPCSKTILNSAINIKQRSNAFQQCDKHLDSRKMDIIKVNSEPIEDLEALESMEMLDLLKDKRMTMANEDFEGADWMNCVLYDECVIPDEIFQLAYNEEDSSQEVDVDTLFHTHFGAGRLGLGLVAPALKESGIPFCIVQRPKTTWRAITSQGTGAKINIEVNGSPIIDSVAVALDDKNVEDLEERSLVCSADAEKLKMLVEQSTSFTCALGSAMKKVVVPLMKELPKRPKSERPVLYACENDHAMVSKIAETLKGRVDVVSCMVDRICTGRDIDSTHVDVLAEPWPGSIVVLKPTYPGRVVPIAGETVTIPKTKDEAKFLYERKLFLVNGMHTTLAFLTLSRTRPSGSETGEFSLLTYDDANEEDRKVIWAWAMARCMMLIENHGMELLAATYESDKEEEIFQHLIDFATTTLKRFSTIDDKTSRVLGGGVANRWATRLRPVYSFMEYKSLEGSVYERFLKYAGLDEEFTKKAISDLLFDSHRFCQKDIRAAVCELVEFYKDDGENVDQEKATAEG
mmetsp:Transcript_38719/g.51024  ORF Transcript_38719/g.51024 Transcript_38719/m.51024 type:complete len:550 (-) Transcript_38719:300-1949(-)